MSSELHESHLGSKTLGYKFMMIFKCIVNMAKRIRDLWWCTFCFLYKIIAYSIRAPYVNEKWIISIIILLTIIDTTIQNRKHIFFLTIITNVDSPSLFWSKLIKIGVFRSDKKGQKCVFCFSCFSVNFLHTPVYRRIFKKRRQSWSIFDRFLKCSFLTILK